MGRRPLATAALAIALAMIAAPAASAAPPDHYTTQVSGTAVVTDICPFPVTVDYVQIANEVDRYDGAGDLVGIEVAIHEQDTFTGVSTLVGEPYTFHLSFKLDAEGQPVKMTYAGVLEKVRLPGGLMVTAGWSSFPDGEFVIVTPQHGTSPDVAAFCAALGG